MNLDEEDTASVQPNVDSELVAETTTPLTAQEIESDAVTVDNRPSPLILPAYPVESTSASERDLLLGLQSEADSFVRFAAKHAIDFLDNAAENEADTVDNLRGQSEEELRDRFKLANSYLVIAYWYGDAKDDEALKEAVGVYAKKMQTIISHIGIGEIK